jgi:predicted hydrocarbon binding protein
MVEENPLLKFIKEGKVEITKDGKIIGFNEYAIILPIRVLNKLFFLLKENFGEDKAEEILKELGRFQVKQAIQRYVKIFGWGYLSKDKILEYAKQIAFTLGLGKYEFRKLNNEYSIIISKTPFAEELLLEYSRQNRPVDHYIKGIWEMFFEALLGKPMICEEVKCYAKGDDCCEFIVKPKE